MTRRERGVYKRGEVGWIDYTDLRGKRHQERVGLSYRVAVRARRQRLADIEAGRFGLRHRGRAITLQTFVDQRWRPEVARGLRPATKRSYEANLLTHPVPAFGSWPLGVISRGDVRAFVAKLRSENPTLTPKTIKNIVGLLGALLEYAASDYELIASNPIRGMLAKARRLIPDYRPRPTRVLEAEQLRDAIDRLPVYAARMAIVAALAGLRWGELIALRLEKDIDYRRNVVRVTEQLQKRLPLPPKTPAGVREVDMTPLVRKVMESTSRASGFIFSPDGARPLGEGRWIKRQWKRAQLAAGIAKPISWRELRHQYVSSLIAAGKDVLYIASQVGHTDPGFTLRQYGHLFKTLNRTPVEWIDDLVWPSGCHASVTLRAATTRNMAAEHALSRTSESK